MEDNGEVGGQRIQVMKLDQENNKSLVKYTSFLDNTTIVESGSRVDIFSVLGDLSWALSLCFVFSLTSPLNLTHSLLKSLILFQALL